MYIFSTFASLIPPVSLIAKICTKDTAYEITFGDPVDSRHYLIHFPVTSYDGVIKNWKWCH